MLEKVIDKVAALGVPGLVLVIVISTSGLAGAAAIAAALAALGGPFGMLGGIAALGVIGLISQAITRYGVEAVAFGSVRRMVLTGKSKSQIKKEIDALPSIVLSKELKRQLIELVENANVRD